ncbi:MAG: hypothetical protein R2860_11555 [Desulfobacterales bacterium]
MSLLFATEHAAAAGVDAVLLVDPCYNGPSSLEIRRICGAGDPAVSVAGHYSLCHSRQDRCPTASRRPGHSGGKL